MISVLHRPERRVVLVLGGAPPGITTYFHWDAVATATRYVLRVGTVDGPPFLIYDGDVGFELSASLPLASGTYYAQVLAYNGDTLLSTGDTQEVTVA